MFEGGQSRVTASNKLGRHFEKKKQFSKEEGWKKEGRSRRVPNKVYRPVPASPLVLNAFYSAGNTWKNPLRFRTSSLFPPVASQVLPESFSSPDPSSST